MSGCQIFMQIVIMGWVGMAMGKVRNYAFGWDQWVGMVLFSSVSAIYALAAGYWGVVMADFQQGVIAGIAIVIVSVWGVVVAGGPAGIIRRLTEMDQLWRVTPFAFSGFFAGEFPAAWFLTMVAIALLGS